MFVKVLNYVYLKYINLFFPALKTYNLLYKDLAELFISIYKIRTF